MTKIVITTARRKAIRDAILAVEHHLMECRGDGCCSPHVQDEHRKSLEELNAIYEEAK